MYIGSIYDYLCYIQVIKILYNEKTVIVVIWNCKTRILFMHLVSDDNPNDNIIVIYYIIILQFYTL